MERIPRRRFTSEFKAEAVKLVTDQGLTQGEAARQLGISLKSLNHWVGLAKTGQLKESWPRLFGQEIRLDKWSLAFIMPRVFPAAGC